MDDDTRIRTVQQTLVVLGRIGELLDGSLVAAVGKEFATNAIVTTIFHLDVNGPTHPSQLADLHGLLDGDIFRLLERLEEAGVVERRGDQLRNDRRGTVVELTDEGRRMSRRMATNVLKDMDDVRSLLRGLDEIIPS